MTTTNMLHVPADIDLPQPYYDIDIKAVTSELSPGYSSPFEKMEYYTNGLPFDVKVVFRSGIAVIVPHDLDAYVPTKHRFMVRTMFQYRGGVKPDVQQLSGMGSILEAGQRAEIIKGFDFSASLINNGFKRIGLDFGLTDDKLTQSPNGIYIPELDIVITRHINRPTYHPESDEGKVLAVKHAGACDTFSYDVEIVDPDNQYGNRFCNIANVVFKIENNIKQNKQPGVYLTITSKELIQTDHYSFEEADAKLHLFRTRDEAMAYGDILAAREKEHDKLKLDYQILKQQLEYKTLGAKDHYENKSLIQKDHYESRSHERKDTSETIKWAPAIATAAGVAIGLFAKAALSTVSGGLSWLLPF